jgi:hypothetical protein
VALSSAKRALIAVFVLVLLVCGAAAVYWVRLQRPFPAFSEGKPPDIMNLLPGDAPVVIYIDAQTLRELQGSPLAAVLGLTNPSPQQDRDYADFVRETGFNYESDLDRAAVAVWPAGMATLENPLGDDHVFAVAEGRFDQNKIAGYALRTGHIETRGSRTIYEVPGEPPIAFQFLSANRIVIASGKAGDALLGEAAPQARDAAMQARIDRVAGAPFFGVARLDHLSESFYENFRNFSEADKVVRSIRALSLSGKPQGNDILLALDAECDSIKNALEISTLLDIARMYGSVALSDPHTRSRMTKQQVAFAKAFLRSVDVSHQDRLVRITLNTTPDMLQAASAASASHGGALNR